VKEREDWGAEHPERANRRTRNLLAPLDENSSTLKKIRTSLKRVYVVEKIQKTMHLSFSGNWPQVTEVFSYSIPSPSVPIWSLLKIQN
jgi:hypothetical protein